ncbi:MAG TPA: hypothetical protein VFI24_22240 [Pyrinomonadaceae bacterium]|nr:hypothetical protein [Pyrinomonadaceae bacterium]
MRDSLTFRRVVPIVLLSMVFVLAVRQSVSIDPDLWWHLKAGQVIVDARSIPHTDDFSFTKQGSEWVAHEWLSEVLMVGIYRLSGLVGLVTIFSLIIVAALLLVYRRCEGRPYAASIAILLAAAASSPLFGVRPQMITLLLASIYVVLLERFDPKEQSRRLWWLVPLMLLWVNLHAGFALGLALIGLYVVRAVLDGEWDQIKPLLIVLVICTAMVPLNPNGFRMFSYPYETLTSTSMAAFIQEWASPDFHKTTFLPFAVLLLSTFAAMALSPARARLGEVFLVLITALGALRSARHIPIFALFAAPVLAKHLWAIAKQHGWDKLLTAEETRPSGLKLVINVVLLIVPLALGISRVWHFATHQSDYVSIRNPTAAVEFLKANRLPGPIYNRYGWGGYLIYKLYPDYRVYIDGRADVYGDAFFAEAMRAYDGAGDWASSLDRWTIKTVLISPDAPLASVLRNDSGRWKVVYEDADAIIFTRN